MSRRFLPVVVLALTTAPALAHGANGLRPRTPAEFSQVPCVQTVTRGDVLHIEYSVAADDTELTPDELTDSRTQQFFAFSHTAFDFRFPVWINRSDFDRAEANGDITVEFGPEDILSESSRFGAGSWVAITPDDPRLPITLDQAAMGVDWDTSDVSPGTWMVAGYTWEPENNLWAPRFGAVRVVDPADPDATGPTAFMTRADGLLANRAEPLPIAGCIEAPEGSTITASWGTLSGDLTEPEWVPFVEDEPVESGALELEFQAPAETGDTVKLRIEITDPSGRSYVAFSPTTITVVGDAPETPDEPTCECVVSQDPSRGTTPLLILGGLLLLRRRRRRQRVG